MYNENNQFPEEAEILAAIKRLITPDQKIIFKDGDDERSINIKGDRSYGLFSNTRKTRKSLINQGFDVGSINLNNTEVPAGTSVLVLADPAKPLGFNSAERIRRYLDAGGNMLITGEPQHREVINPILQQLGARLSEGMMVNPDKNTVPDLINAKFKGIDNKYFNQMSKPFAIVAMPTAAMLEVKAKGFTIDTLLQSTADGWNKVNGFDPSSISVSYEPGKGDKKGRKPLMITLTRTTANKEQKILISGDADFMSDNLVTQAYNFPFINGIFRWFSNGSFPVIIKRNSAKDNAILASRKQLSAYKTATLWGLPALIISFGAALLLGRRKK